MRRKLSFLLLVFLAGAAVGRVTKDCPTCSVSDSGTLVQRDSELPGVVNPPKPGIRGIPQRVVEKVKFRELRPEAVTETPREPSAVECAADLSAGGLDGVEAGGNLGSAKIHRIDQVTKRGDRLSVYVHGDSSDLKVDFRLSSSEGPDYDAVATPTLPFVREARCWACELRLSLEAGLLQDAAGTQPYGAAEASIAVLRRDLRALGRVESDLRDARLMAGVRYTF